MLGTSVMINQLFVSDCPPLTQHEWLRFKKNWCAKFSETHGSCVHSTGLNTRRRQGDFLFRPDSAKGMLSAYPVQPPPSGAAKQSGNTGLLVEAIFSWPS